MPLRGSGQKDRPAIRAIDPWLVGNPHGGKTHQLLTDDQRVRLAAIASIVRFNKGEKIYGEGEPAAAIFNLISGVIKTYRTAADGSEHIAAILYADDLCGLSEEGRYTNSAKAMTSVSAYSLPTVALRREMSKDADLNFRVIAKLCHELRETQRHALLLAQKHAVAKLAMFLRFQERLQSASARPSEIYVPIDRSDIADYVGMSPAAVSRGFRDLETRGIITHRDRRHVKIVDRPAFEKLASEPVQPTGGVAS